MKVSEQMTLNRNLAQMLKGGVIMDVTTPEQAKIAEAAGACAVMALERIPADIRAAGGVSRMSDPGMIRGIQAAVSIPVMAKCRIGHIAEARILEAIDIRLYRRERSAQPRRRRIPHRQDKIQGSVCVRRQRSRRSSETHLGGRVDDQDKGRTRHRRHRAGRAPYEEHQLIDRQNMLDGRGRAFRRGKKPWSRIRAREIHTRKFTSAGCKFCGRRSGDSGRRSADDDAWAPTAYLWAAVYSNPAIRKSGPQPSSGP